MAVNIEHQFRATADRLWEVLGKPDRVDWVPGVQHCVLEGDVRSLTLPGAGNIKERILFYSNEQRIIEYSCFEAPGTLKTHYARMEVIPNAKGCQLLWHAEVTPVNIEAFIRKSMEACLARLEQLLNP
jgi:hypothetical protein